MIEVVSRSRCVGCDLCIRVCPTDVFERDTDGIPVIARQEDCQTCFSCEIYCPVDALYVAPLTGPAPDGSPHREEEHLAATGALGAYRRTVGWGGGRTPGSRYDRNHLFTAGMTGQPGTRPNPLSGPGLPQAESPGPDLASPH
ncbi:4Fe-4S dicluster domain-containing protein [Streptomyces brasiliensis]|uniref:Ferredoxin n=1 Tax=Streptomyces brasiliensis TaxID=1954 RepID=A0A917PCK4_9ACTN|nr:ferredoxin family protein [Streptomyces brasiliensis]GGJ70638.1 ferredoxin [Streptomyces brasiliensis]